MQRTGSGLEKIDVDESVKNIGGLAGLRKWLNEKKELLTPEKRDELRAKGLQPPRGILLVMAGRVRRKRRGGAR